jgi:DegV family protein with EDD domain
MVQSTLGYDTCHVFDGKNGTGGQRMLVEYAVRLRDEGCSAPRIVEALEAVRDRVVLYACIDTLQYLYLGGRISQTVYKLGTLANIKPIISVDTEGRVTVPAKAMGMRKGIDHLCKRLQSQPPCPDFPLYVMHTNNRSTGETLAQHFRQMGYDIPEERIIPVGAAIGAHVGPDACGFVYIA